MTESEALALPRRELDALVATKVMGASKPAYVPSSSVAINKQLVGNPYREGPWTVSCDFDNRDLAEWVPDPFSTDISAAWEVVEKLNSRGAGVALDADPGNGVGVHVYRYKAGAGIREYTHSDADTAPLAICLAALKAVGEIE